MDIAFCLHISLAYGGGGEKWAVTVANALSSKGHDVQIYALPYAPNNRKVMETHEALANGVEYYEGWNHTVDADVAYVFYNPLTYVFFRARCPKIAGIHSQIYFLPKTPPLTYGLPAISARLLYKIMGQADISLFNAVHVVNNFTVKHKKVYCIPNFVNTSVYEPRCEKRDRFTVLFVGRPNWQKGWDVFLKTAEIVRGENNDVDFMWVGGRDQKVRKIVDCLGYVSDEYELSRIYSAAHVTLLPSRADNFAISMLESLACGTPVITSPISSHKILDLPLIYGNSARDYAEIIKKMRNLWLSGTDEFSNISCEARSVAKRYDILNLIPRIEAMLVETAKA
jgi:glycosyltransferase involved in cell wall biosynthesis